MAQLSHSGSVSNVLDGVAIAICPAFRGPTKSMEMPVTYVTQQIGQVNVF